MNDIEFLSGLLVEYDFYEHINIHAKYSKQSKQSSGGPRGLRATCVCAKIVMNALEARGSA